MHTQRSMFGAVAAAALVAASLMLGGSGASAAPHSATHATATRATAARTMTEKFFISGVNNKQVVIAHGAFTGGGKDVSTGQKDLLSLGGGTLTIKHPNKKSHFKSHVNTKTCFITFAITGKYTLGNGTGKYVGWTGHGTYVVTGQGILQRAASGKCNQRKQPKVEGSVVVASGPVTSS